MRTFIVSTLAWSLLIGTSSAGGPLFRGEPLCGWRMQLHDPSVEARRQAGEAFRDMDVALLKQAIEELTRAVTDEDVQVRRSVAQALSKVGPAATSAIPALIKASEMKQGDPRFVFWARYHAIAALGNIGPRAKEAIPVLTRQLGSGDPLDEYRAEALGKIGPEARVALPALVKLFRAANQPGAQSHAGIAIAQIDPQAPELPEIVRGLVRAQAFTKCVGPTPELNRAFLQLFPDLALKHTIPLLKSDDKTLRIHATLVLAAAGPKAKEQTAKPLVEALQDPAPEVRGAVAHALFIVAPSEFRPAIEVLVKLVGKRQYSGFNASIMLRSYAKEACPQLIRELEGKTGDEQAELVHALYCLKPESRPFLDAALSESAAVRVGAAKALGLIGADASGSIPGLLRLTAAEDRESRLAGVEALLLVDLRKQHLAQWLPRVEALVREKNPPAQARAVSVLRSLGPNAKSAVPTLLTAMNQGQGDLRLQMAITVVWLDRSEGSNALPVLLEAIQSPRPGRFMDLVNTLGELGPVARDALPALRQRFTEQKDNLDQEVKVAKAMARIDRGEIAACLPAVSDRLKKGVKRPYQLVELILMVAEWGPDAKAAEPELRVILADQRAQSRARLAAAVGLILIGVDRDDAAVKVIRQLMASVEDPEDRWEFLDLLGRIGPRAAALAPEVRALLKDANFGEDARKVLGKIAPAKPK